MSQVTVQNWKRTITYHANSVEMVESVDDIMRIVKDPRRYPSPVRAKGSHHSTTRCIAAGNGTVVDMTKMISIWAFPREEYPQTIRDYFQFCKDYYRDNGYRCDILNVGYYIAQDRQSLFSYTRRGPPLTLDPVSTGSTGWNGFITAYTEFSIQHNGTPLFNQTRGITPLQAQAAFGSEITTFLEYRRKYDPDERFYSDYFRERFETPRGRETEAVSSIAR